MSIFNFPRFQSVLLILILLKGSPAVRSVHSMERGGILLQRTVEKYSDTGSHYSRKEHKNSEDSEKNKKFPITGTPAFTEKFDESRRKAMEEEKASEQLRKKEEKIAAKKCQTNRKLITAAIHSWARHLNNSSLHLPTVEELVEKGFLPERPLCPAGGEYWISRPAEAPAHPGRQRGFWVCCSIHSRTGNLKP